MLGSSRGDLALELNLLDHDAIGSPYFAVRTEDGVVAISMPFTIFEAHSFMAGDLSGAPQPG